MAASIVATSPARVGRPASSWIVSPAYDSLLFTGSILVPMLLWGAFSLGFLTGVGVYLVFQLLFNMPHNFQTWTMSVLDDADRARHGRRYAAALAITVALFGGAMLLSPDGAYPALRDALVYWGYYHLVRQHYGFQRLYERRMAMAGAAVPPRESKAYARFLDVVSYAPLLLRFRDPELMTIRAGSRTVWIWHPVFPPVAWHAVAVAYAAVIALAIAHHAWLARTGRKELAPRAWLLASVTVAFGVAALVVRDLVVAIALVTTFHNVQYLGLTLFHNRTRADIAAREGGQAAANPLVRLLVDRRFAVYALVSVAYGILIFAPRAAWRGALLAELPITVVVAMHYYVDARIWRFPDYPALGRYLRLRA